MVGLGHVQVSWSRLGQRVRVRSGLHEELTCKAVRRNRDDHVETISMGSLGEDFTGISICQCLEMKLQSTRTQF